MYYDLTLQQGTETGQLVHRYNTYTNVMSCFRLHHGYDRVNYHRRQCTASTMQIFSYYHLHHFCRHQQLQRQDRGGDPPTLVTIDKGSYVRHLRHILLQISSDKKPLLQFWEYYEATLCWHFLIRRHLPENEINPVICRCVTQIENPYM